MKLDINPRENGACPLCIYNDRCPIKDKLSESVEDIIFNDPLNIVIYSCPKFEEIS